MAGAAKKVARGGTDPAGRVAVVTGAGSGIGRATALALAAAGATVVSVDVDTTAAERTAKEVGRGGTAGPSFTVDVADRAAVTGLAAAVEDEVGPVGILVNNAGVGMTGRFLDMTDEDWDWILGVNLQGVRNGCAAFGPAMVARRAGHVVNLASGLGFTPRATESAYCTTKAAVLMLSQCLRADWRSSGVGVTAICPGVINTPIIDSTRFVGARAASRDRTVKAFRRGHAPELVAEAVVDSVRRNRSVVPVGAESHVGWGLHRILPSRAASRLGALDRI
jgi:NAD(P)-dependent dehydrogenase (short-subunit alcohol dehydrogenase family)